MNSGRTVREGWRSTEAVPSKQRSDHGARGTGHCSTGVAKMHEAHGCVGETYDLFHWFGRPSRWSGFDDEDEDDFRFDDVD